MSPADLPWDEIEAVLESSVESAERDLYIAWVHIINQICGGDHAGNTISYLGFAWHRLEFEKREGVCYAAAMLFGVTFGGIDE